MDGSQNFRLEKRIFTPELSIIAGVSKHLSTDPGVIALGMEDGFFHWADEICDEQVKHCQALDRALRTLREELVEFVLVYMPDLELEPSKLFSILRQETTEMPLIAVYATEPDERLARDLYRQGVVTVVQLDMPPSIARAALRQARDASHRQRRLDGDVRRLASALKSMQRWRDDTTRVVDELLHDLRTPAGVLKGFLANLLDGIHGELNAEQADAVGRMKTAADFLAELLTSVRERLPARATDASQPQIAEPRRRGRRQIFLAEVCEQVVQMFEPKARSAQVKLSFQPKECPAIWAERSRIVQLLVNLVSNAMRHTPPGGAIEVRMGHELDQRGELWACRLTVQDTGIGIPAGHQDQVFRAGFTTGDSPGNQGMGLAICKQVVAEHKGSIELESAAGQGAVFHCRLPLDPRSGSRDLVLSRVEDPVLVGQLLVELRRRGGGHELVVEKPKDMEVLARKLLAQGGSMVLTGDLDPSLQKILEQ